MSAPKNIPQYFAMLDKLASGSKKVIEEDTPYRNAVRFRGIVLMNIVKQKYASSFKRLSKAYEDKKARLGQAQGFWRMSNDLIRSLKAFRYKKGKLKGWVGGVIPGTANANGEDITKYGLAVENSIKGGRPVFGMTTNDYYGKDLKIIGKDAVKKIKLFWR